MVWAHRGGGAAERAQRQLERVATHPGHRGGGRPHPTGGVGPRVPHDHCCVAHVQVRQKIVMEHIN